MQPRCQLLSGRLATPRIPVRASQSQRSYATAAPTPVVKNPLQRRRGGDLGFHLPKHVIPKDLYIPPYPHGDHALYKQANRGLYGDQRVQFGNNVSPRTETKTRREWKVNVLSKSLYSVALKKKIKLRITANVLKTMDREGGLDEYLLKDNEHRLKELGPLGWALRCTLIQKPEVVVRLRSEAAALGLDQATIDKQWPTREMLAKEKTAQAELVRAADLIGEEPEEDVAAAEEEPLDAEEEPLDAEAETPDAEGPGELEPANATANMSKAERRITRDAKKEYAKAVKAAQRYLSRGMVDSEEAGLKLAFVRAIEREEAAIQLKANFAKKLNERFSPEELEEVRAKFELTHTPDPTIRRIAYNQWRRTQIGKAGSQEAWIEQTQADRAERRAAIIEEAGGKAAWEAQRKREYADAIAEAEAASTNKSLDAKRRAYLRWAITKAHRAIKARAPSEAQRKRMYADAIAEAETVSNSKSPEARRTAYLQAAIMKADKNFEAKTTDGEDAYVEAMLDDVRQSRSRKPTATGSATRKQKSGGDAWAALVNSSNAATESRPRA
jgi:large subunit ribosomal protein L28